MLLFVLERRVLILVNAHTFLLSSYVAPPPPTYHSTFLIFILVFLLSV
jgi:hypothetical protein